MFRALDKYVHKLGATWAQPRLMHMRQFFKSATVNNEPVLYSACRQFMNNDVNNLKRLFTTVTNKLYPLCTGLTTKTTT